MKRLAIIIIVTFFLLSLSPQRAHAFWAEDVSLSQTVSSASIEIGDWIVNDYWQEETFYEEGDIVYYDGNYYVAIKKNVPKNKTPDGPAGWVFWEPE